MEQKRKAETTATVYLEMRGFQILERNFRRPRAEVSIIAKKDQTIYFIDVSYVLDSLENPDLIKLSLTKLRQMKRIEYAWCEETKWNGKTTLSQIEIVGQDYMVMNFSETAF